MSARPFPMVVSAFNASLGLYKIPARLISEPTIKDFITKCLDKLEISYFNEGDEFRDNHGNYLIKTNPKFVRPAEVDLLIGDPMKAREKLLWKPKHDLDSLIDDMIQADLKRYGK